MLQYRISVCKAAWHIDFNPICRTKSIWGIGQHQNRVASRENCVYNFNANTTHVNSSIIDEIQFKVKIRIVFICKKKEGKSIGAKYLLFNLFLYIYMHTILEGGKVWLASEGQQYDHFAWPSIQFNVSAGISKVFRFWRFYLDGIIEIRNILETWIEISTGSTSFLDIYREGEPSGPM